MPSHKYSLITLLLSLMLAAFAQNLSQVQNLYTSPNNYPASEVAYSPDGSLLAVVLFDDSNSIKILDADSGREVTSLVGHTSLVISVAFSSDGSFLASGSADKTVKIWRTADFSLVDSLEGHTSYVRSIAFSPAGDFLASGSDDKTVKIWRTADFSLVDSLEEHTNWVYSVTFSPAGDFLASGSDDKTVKIWRTADFSLVASLEEYTNTVTSVAFSPAGDFLASGSRDNTVKIWRTADFSLVASLEEHTRPVFSVAFSPAGDFLASGSWDNTVKIWHVNDSYSLHKTIAGINGNYGIGSVAFHPAGTSLALANMKKYPSNGQGVVSLWGVSSGQAVFCPSGCGAAPPVQYASVTINSTAGARVTINGQAIPESRAGVFAARIQEGTYQVQARKDGYVSASASLQARLQGSNQLDLVLQEIPVVTPSSVTASPVSNTTVNQPVILPPATSNERRVALVMGNDNYIVNPLDNPVNDARAVATALRGFGFEVIERLNLDKTAMETALVAFERTLQDTDVALVYFAGHGVEVDGDNYLVPISANPSDAIELRHQSIGLASILTILQRNSVRFNIVILDACRNNPFEAIRTMGASGTGLAKVDARDFRPQASHRGSGARGMYLAFATEPGWVAKDGVGQHSPYTASLLHYFETAPYLEIGQLFRSVREEVYEITNEQQLPWDNTNMMGDFYFRQP